MNCAAVRNLGCGVTNRTYATLLRRRRQLVCRLLRERGIGLPSCARLADAGPDTRLIRRIPEPNQWAGNSCRCGPAWLFGALWAGFDDRGRERFHARLSAARRAMDG